MASTKIVKEKTTIQSVTAWEVFDSRGFPTVACQVVLADGTKATAMVPSGASTGEKEALELRDGDKARMSGKGVLKAVANVNKKIAPKVIGLNAAKQAELDAVMISLDGTPNKEKLGANAILSVSMAAAKAAARSVKIPLYKHFAKLAKQPLSKYVLPAPMLNVINGGAHADNTIDFQEFMLFPLGFTSTRRALQAASEVFHALQSILKSKGLSTGKGDEGGFAPNLKNAEEALDLMLQAVTKAGYKPGKDIYFALDCAASEIYDEAQGKYVFKKALKAGHLSASAATMTSSQLVDYLENLTKKYPIVSIEDGLAENDWDGMTALTKRLGSKIQIVGDDTYCTNPELTAKGVALNATNAVLIKLNQIGTITETIKTVKIAYAAGWKAVVSHRSGETEDTTIADLAVGLGTGQIKTGSMSRSERIAKYNRLIRIEDTLGRDGKYAGESALASASASTPAKSKPKTASKGKR